MNESLPLLRAGLPKAVPPTPVRENAARIALLVPAAGAYLVLGTDL